MSTTTFVNTYTHSVTYVTDKLLTSIKNIVRLSGLNPGKLSGQWGTLERGISVWLNDQDLDQIHLEVYHSKTGNLVGRWDFEIFYGYTGDGSFYQDPDAIRYHITKQGLFPSDCDYQVIVTNKPGYISVAGWSTGNLLSTDGFVRQSIGTTIDGSGLSTGTGYWRKK